MRKITILFFICLGFVIWLNFTIDAKAEVVYQGWVFWSNETKQFFSGPSYTRIDNNTYVVAYSLKEGWVKIHAEIPTLLAFCDPFSGKWVKKFVKKGETNITLPFKPQPYGGLRLLMIGSPWGFGFIKEKEDVLSWGDYPIVILLSEMAKWAWERAFYSVCLAFVGLAYAYFVKRELLIVNRGWQMLFAVFGVVLIFLVLGLTHHPVKVQIVQGNQTITKTIEALEFSGYRIKQFYNYAFAFMFIFGYLIGLKFFRNEYFTTVKPLMDRIEINSYPVNINKGVIRDFDGKIAKLEIIEPIGKFTVTENGYTVDAFVEIERKTEDVPKRVELTNKKALIVSFGVVGLIFIGNFLNLFKIDLISTAIITGVVFTLINLGNIKEILLTPSRTLTIYSTELITNDRYYADLLNGKLKEMAKVYNKLRKELIKKEFEIDYKIATEIFSIAKSLEVTPEPSEGGET
jgi:hypothetical protein